MPSSGSIDDRNNQPDSGHGELPAGYGETMAALLPRDPNWMFIYWEISPGSRARIVRENGPDVFEKSRQVLRVYDTGSAGAGGPAHFDVPVMLDEGSWYVHVQEAGRSYCCELGLVLPSGSFLGIVKSNTVSLPSGRVSGETDGKWMSVSGDFEKLLQLSGVEYIGKGSGEVAKSLAQRWEMLRAVFSRGASWGVSSLAAPAAAPQTEKTFRLVADCELILYGATEPDAYVTVCGRKVSLNPDGTFSMRFALPDGVTGLPVKAISGDGTDSRTIDISITRATTNGGQ